MQLSTIGTTVLDIFGWGVYTCYITSTGLDVFRTSDGVKVAWCYRSGATCGTANDSGIYIGTTTGVYFIAKENVSGACTASLLYNSVQLQSSSIYDIDTLGHKMVISNSVGIDFIPDLQNDSVIYSCALTLVKEIVMNETRIACLKTSNIVYVMEHPSGDWTTSQMKRPGSWANSPSSPTLLAQDTSLYPTGQDRFRIIHLKDDYFVCCALDDPAEDHYWSNAYALILYRVVRGKVYEIQRFNQEIPVFYQHRFMMQISDDSFFIATGSDSHRSVLIQLVNGRLECTQYYGPGNIVHGPLTPTPDPTKFITTGDDTTGTKAWLLSNLDGIPTITQQTWMSFDGNDKRADLTDGQYILGRSAGHLYPGHWGGSSYVADPVLADWDDDKASTVQAMFVRSGIAYIQHTNDLYFTMYDMTVNTLVDTIVGTLAFPANVDTFFNADGDLIQVNNYQYFVGVNETNWDLHVCTLAADGLSFELQYILSPRTDPGYRPITVCIGERYAMAHYDYQEDLNVWELAPDTWNLASLGSLVVDIDLGEELFIAVDNFGIMCVDVTDLEGDLPTHTIPVAGQDYIKSVSVTSDATRTQGLIGYCTLTGSGIFDPTEP